MGLGKGEGGSKTVFTFSCCIRSVYDRLVVEDIAPDLEKSNTKLVMKNGMPIVLTCVWKTAKEEA